MYHFYKRSSRYKLEKCHYLSILAAKLNPDGTKCRRRSDNAAKASCDLKKYRNDAESYDSGLSSESCAFVGKFEDFNDILNERVISSLHKCGYVNLTAIQKSTIPKILEGCDTLIRSATGSGKTLTFLVPAIHFLVAPHNGIKITRSDGTKVLIISPTRELSVQTEKTAANLAKPFPWIVVTSIKGGDSRKSEKARIRKGITLLVGTPGRILDHCETTSSFNVKNLELFVMDEADRLLDMGFEVKIKKIYDFISTSLATAHTKRNRVQTVLTSATLTNAVEKLAKFCLHTKPTMIGLEKDLLSLPTTLVHEYILTECKNKFIVLISLLLKYLDNNEKVIVFVSNCQSVIYMHTLIQSLTWPLLHKIKNVDDKAIKIAEKYEDAIEDYDFRAATMVKEAGARIFNKIPIFMLHGNMEPNDRAGYISDFIKRNCGLLISTDVASRGLNLEHVNRVIQYDPPQQLEEYIHRSGRSARLGGKGNAILLLMTHEHHFVEELRKRGITAREIKHGKVWSWVEQQYIPKYLKNFKGDLIGFLRNSFCNLVRNESHLLPLAQQAFKSSLQSYKTYSKELRRIFDFRKLHLGHYATSYCLNQKPSDLITMKTKRVGPNNNRPHSDQKRKVVQSGKEKVDQNKRSRHSMENDKSVLDATKMALELLMSRDKLLSKV
ncbi:bifunctional Helicase superfamily 1-2 [Babesia duncani]|uniref:ATP-dependent RNA helicase n=1 Tax=Babesia duncani TaxID=323732 RepID=A0AAD9UPF8_9APIC|nr:bifunctional Helicase superfamily 1-2 [Babesia duncani]